MRRTFKRRRLLLALATLIVLIGLGAWLTLFNTSDHISWAKYRELQLGMTYDEAYIALGGWLHDVDDVGLGLEANSRLRWGFSEDDESQFPPRPAIWITVDKYARLNSKEYKEPSLKMIWDRLVVKINVAAGRSPPPRPPIQPVSLEGSGWRPRASLLTTHQEDPNR